MVPPAIHRRLSRWLLFYFSLFAPFKMDSMLIGSREDKDKLKRTIFWGRQLVLALYIYSNLRILVNIYFQYQHDWHTLRLNYLINGKTTIDSTVVHKTIAAMNRSLLNAEGIKLMDSLQESRRILKLIGAPHLNCTMETECVYILVILLTVSIYFYGYIVADQIPDTHFTSMLNDERVEFAIVDQMIAKEVKEFLISSRNSVLSVIDRVLECEQIIDMAQIGSGESFGKRLPEIDEHESYPISSGDNQRQTYLQEKVAQHKMLIQQANQLVEFGELVPANRSIDWVDQISLKFATFSINNFIYSVCQDTFVFFYLPDLLGDGLDMPSCTDYWFMCDIWLAIIISISSTTYYVGIASIYTVDQTRYVGKLQADYKECIHKNLSQLEEILREPMMDRHEKRARLDTINLGLVKSILQYKIFLVQFEPVRKSFSAVVLSTCVMLVLIPAVIRIHLPYNLGSLTRSVAIIASLVMFAITDGVLVPYCIIHHEGEKLYTLMCRLLAHAIEVNEIFSCEMNMTGCSAVYNEHNIDLLRRILADPDGFSDQFAARAFWSLHLTFGKLVEIHYWYSLVILSNFFQLDSWRRLFGSRLDDPLSIIHLSAI
jgi:hypothetical protein